MDIINDEKYATLTYRNQKSTDFGIFIRYPFQLTHAIPDYNKSHINGRNGDFIQDEGSYQNVNETFDIVAQIPSKYSTLFEYEAAITEWLQGNDYDYLKINTFPDYVFEAIVDTAYSITWDENDPRFGIGQLIFDCKPFYKRADGIYYQPLPSNKIVYNTEKVPAIPDWHFIAKGDFTLSVNGFPYEFNGIDGDVWLNGQEGNAMNKKDGDYTNLINSNLRLANNTTPVLAPNTENKIEIIEGANSVTKAEYRPNWGRLI